MLISMNVNKLSNDNFLDKKCLKIGELLIRLKNKGIALMKHFLIKKGISWRTKL